jgi:TRAP-type C4-dicarboxylate transport system substrate-binding protein
MRRALLIACLLMPALARADGTLLRLATVAPDGTGWAREFRAFSADIERRTEGRVRLKPYWGSIAGGDLEVAERIRRGQLDGAASGGPLCTEVMPSLKVTQVPGLFENVDEVKYILNHLFGAMESEAAQAGFTNLGTVPLGAGAYLGRREIRSLAELRATSIWVWDAQKVLVPLFREMGLKVVAAPIDRASRDFYLGRIDGFWAIPTAALAFQWSARSRYLITLHGEYVVGCVLLANRVFAGLSLDDQRALKAAGAQLRDRGVELLRRDEQALLGGLFQKQGLTVIEPGEKLRAEFFAAANAARDRVGAQLLPPELLQRVRGLLSDYRAEHSESSR